MTILFQYLTQDTTILTPNRRLSATLLKKYNQFKITEKQACWASLPILPFTSWIQRLWLEYVANQINEVSPLLLTSQQELILWEEILQQFPANEVLLQLSETAKLAKTAWERLKQWRVDLTHPALSTTEDSHSFLIWATQFQKTCQTNNWIDFNSLIHKIIKKISSDKMVLPKRLILTGFTEFSPLQNYLFSCLEEKGVRIIDDKEITCGSSSIKSTSIKIPPINSAKRIRLENEETEIYAMARWSKSLLNSDPTLSIGCIVPNLEKIRDHVLPVFSDVFNENDQLFNISAGKSLATYPIIHSALQLLHLNHQSISIEKISQLLLSPFLGDSESEFIKRAQLDAYLRKLNITQITLEKLNLTSTPRLAKRIKKLLAFSQELPPFNTISEWVPAFIKILDILGWPGERSLDSHEYQLVQRWLELLVDYQTFDTVLTQKNYQKTLHYLTRLAANVIFQPKSVDTAVQILGVLEAAGLPFDHAWVIGFDDSAWPPPAKPNPFIPYPLQATLQMPHATAEHEFDYSKRLIDQLKQNTKQLIFSHAEHNAHSELRTSPLIIDLPEITIEELKLTPFTSRAEKSRQSQRIEMIEDTKAPALTTAIMQGGAMIFKLQAACPFKAFAEIRLKAKPIESPVLGLTPENRGKITHKALEFLWKEIKDSIRLQSYDEITLKDIINTVVTQAFQIILNKAETNSRYLSLEKTRLNTLLWEWLQIEKQRPPFKVIACEETRSITISNLTMTVRVDRIDEVVDAANQTSYLIIDYKTGHTNSIKHWFGDRLDEPQLPLYCITATNAATHIAFAEINSLRLGFKGISQNDLATEGMTCLSDTPYSENRPWEQQVITWRTTLEKLGSDFVNGHAEVDPKMEIETCRYCQLHALCRVHEN
jgi:probable DNA repair protein